MMRRLWHWLMSDEGAYTGDRFVFYTCIGIMCAVAFGWLK